MSSVATPAFSHTPHVSDHSSKHNRSLLRSPEVSEKIISAATPAFLHTPHVSNHSSRHNRSLLHSREVSEKISSVATPAFSHNPRVSCHGSQHRYQSIPPIGEEATTVDYTLGRDHRSLKYVADVGPLGPGVMADDGGEYCVGNWSKQESEWTKPDVSPALSHNPRASFHSSQHHSQSKPLRVEEQITIFNRLGKVSRCRMI